MIAFKRYTNLASTIDLLRTETVTLLNPATWDDKNDAYFMSEYKRYRSTPTLLALCFAECAETYHHWRVFAPGTDGVCLEFNKAELLSMFDRESGGKISHGYVQYELIKEVSALRAIDGRKLPFLKRFPYRDENEYRVIYEDREPHETKRFPISNSWIRRITLSPWLPESLADSVRATLRELTQSDVKVSRSTLIENEAWKALTAKAWPEVG